MDAHARRRDKVTAQPYTDALRPEDRDRLIAMHPAGRARFWGATKVQNRKYDTKISAGDIVLFTGGRQVRAIGRIGVILRDTAAFGDLLWEPDPKNGSWCNVYSVQGFSEVAIPYEECCRSPRRSPVSARCLLRARASGRTGRV
jgi:hypothetical protein